MTLAQFQDEVRARIPGVAFICSQCHLHINNTSASYYESTFEEILAKLDADMAVGRERGQQAKQDMEALELSAKASGGTL